jgi:hypothetical protein
LSFSFCNSTTLGPAGWAQPAASESALTAISAESTMGLLTARSPNEAPEPTSDEAERSFVTDPRRLEAAAAKPGFARHFDIRTHASNASTASGLYDVPRNPCRCRLPSSVLAAVSATTGAADLAIKLVDGCAAGRRSISVAGQGLHRRRGGSGAAWFDYDNDGNLDVLIVNG